MSRPVTVVVPSHGPAHQMAPLLEALARQARDGEPLAVIVSDDASPTPLGPDLVRPPGLVLEVVRGEANGGPGAARNRGLVQVRTPWVAFLDADTLPSDDWLARAEQLVQADGAADFVEGRTRIPAEHRPDPFTHATEATPPEQHVAGNVILRTSVLREVGGFDERFFDPPRKLHFREDAELAFRLEQAGASIAYDPDLLVDHPPLPSTFWGPVKLARRYYFDPLLDREHPEAFRAMNAQRRIGPITLRRARHDAAVLAVLGELLVVVGLVGGWAPVAVLGVVAALLGWSATVVALCWRRQVRARHVLPVLVVALVVPWTYLWHWWRGVLRFRHRPRL